MRTASVIEVLRDGVVVVGTAHISPTSVAEVEAAIREHRPRKVLVELDAPRRKALEDPDAWANTDIFRIIREKKQHLFLVQLYLASMQARMGRETGVAPGGEMLKAMQVAAEIGAEVVLIDRDVSVTLRRGFASMGMWARLRMFWNVWMQLLSPASDDEANRVDVEQLLKSDDLTRMTDEFARFAPEIKVALIDERDAYMASHIDEAHKGLLGGSLVAVVGAGHLAGIRNHLKAPESIPPRAPLDVVPTPRIGFGKILGWGIPILLIAGFVWLGFTADWGVVFDEATRYIVLTGGGAALGAALAFGHPVSILVAFVAAPITVLHPLLAAGWFAGLAEAKMRTPKVADFQAIKHIETIGQFWRNGVVRVLLVTALANLGAMVGAGAVGARLLRLLGGT